MLMLTVCVCVCVLCRQGGPQKLVETLAENNNKRVQCLFLLSVSYRLQCIVTGHVSSFFMKHLENIFNFRVLTFVANNSVYLVFITKFLTNRIYMLLLELDKIICKKN